MEGWEVVEGLEGRGTRRTMDLPEGLKKVYLEAWEVIRDLMLGGEELGGLGWICRGLVVGGKRAADQVTPAARENRLLIHCLRHTATQVLVRQ